VLEDREVRAVGAVSSRRIDVRVIAATHRNLARFVERGEFREDLFYRLNVISIRIPALRERREDIPLLVRHFLDVHAERLGCKVVEVAPEAMAVLMERLWRGNVRELENVIERAVVLARGPVIGVDMARDEAALPAAADSEGLLSGRPTLNDLEDRYIELVLRETDGDKNKAAHILGVSKRTLYRRGKRDAGRDAEGT
jgi:DNA-binding NtrC family response regulator